MILDNNKNLNEYTMQLPDIYLYTKGRFEPPLYHFIFNYLFILTHNVFFIHLLFSKLLFKGLKSKNKI